MYGLVLEILESFVLDHPQGGKDVWSVIKRKANCSVAVDQAFLRRSCYSDDELFALVHAAAHVLQKEFKTEADLLLAFGKYMIRHHYLNGYNDLLEANGATLRQWLSNLNSLHDHVAKSFEGSNSNADGENNNMSFQPPIYWCEDCEDVEGSILLHYFTFRGTLLVPMTVGIVQELARYQFGIHVTMTQLALQGEPIFKDNSNEDHGELQQYMQEESECTTWRITATDPSQRWKLSPTVDMDDVIDFSQMEMPSQCPFSGRSLAGSSVGTLSEDSDDTDYILRNRSGATNTAGISKEQLTTIFPFHVLVDRKFTILQVGTALPSILGLPEEMLTNIHIGEIFDIIRPVMGTAWDWQALKKLEDQQFSLVPCIMVPRKVAPSNRLPTSAINSSQHSEDSISSIRENSDNGNNLMKKTTQQNLRKRVSMAGARIRFKGSMLELADPTTRRRRRRRRRRRKRESKASGSMYHSDLDDDDDYDLGGLVMFVLSPDANNVTELRHMGLTLTDLPLHTCQRDAVFLGEYISHEVNMAHNLDKLSKTLELEKNLSNTLLYNMLPKQIADDLRRGNTVAPEHHDNVTLFFSDVVGFTNICDQVDPWAIIDMLNQLYSVMDYLAEKMNLYKVETIGDAYMCCSGLPFADERHAANIANFSLAVVECVKHVLSPADGRPIELRIGIHTGSCTSGVVGTLTPHYCLFGDMVNVTSRHESTGQPGKIQCSRELFARLTQPAKYQKEQFIMAPRGVVDMKGKGKRLTYWLTDGTKANKNSGPKAIQALYEEVGVMLQKQTWKMRQYFRSSGVLRGGDSDSQSLVSGGSGKTESTTGGVSIVHEPQIRKIKPDGSEADGNKPKSDTDPGELDHFIDTKSSHRETRGLAKIFLGASLTREDLVSNIHVTLSPLLELCLKESCTNVCPIERDHRDTQLYSFIDHLSLIFKRNNAYHNFRRTATTVLWTNHLFAQLQELGTGKAGTINNDPWFRLTILFAALLRDCKHAGVSESQLKYEDHMIYLMHGGEHCLAKFGFRYGLDILSDRFPDLWDDITLGFPIFLYCMKKLESPVSHTIDKQNSDRAKLRNTLLAMATVLRMASLGHFALGYKNFTEWNEAAFAELRLANLSDRGSDPTDVWNEQCVRFINAEVLPVAKQCESWMPDVSLNLQETVQLNLKTFKAEGRDCAKRQVFSRRNSLTSLDLDASEKSSTNIDVVLNVFC